MWSHLLTFWNTRQENLSLSFTPYLREQSITTSCQNWMELDSRRQHWQDTHLGNAISGISNEWRRVFQTLLIKLILRDVRYSLNQRGRQEEGDHLNWWWSQPAFRPSLFSHTNWNGVSRWRWRHQPSMPPCWWFGLPPTRWEREV